MPYEKAIYDGPVQSFDSKKSRLYRNRVQIAKENFVSKESTTMKNNQTTIIMKGNEEKEKVMGKKPKDKNMDYTSVRLYLELGDENLTQYQKRMLRRYGESSTGVSISGYILIPSDMKLHNLHYT